MSLSPADMEENRRAERQQWLDDARGIATVMARQYGTVTVDDVRTHCPPPPGADPRILGTVFKTPHFARIGYCCSARRECHRRPIGVFALTGG